MTNRTCWRLMLLIVAVPTAALACLWDHDTLLQERARFPQTLELITGKFLRHSKEFYQWRIEDRLKKLKTNPQPGYYDDLAVAYEKTGQHEDALATMLRKEELYPGLYETNANLGTFHVLAGDFQQGLPYIEKALEINPNAHFGREQYQKWLVEYALTRQVDGQLVLPLLRPQAIFNFHAFLITKWSGRTSLPARQEAVQAILGMMRFANHDNPLLLEALGDLLTDHPEMPEQHSNSFPDAKRLAATAYLKASYEVQDETAKEGYRGLAAQAISLQAQLPLPQLEAEFAAELADAQTWYAELRQRELDWIRQGLDADAEFDLLYDDCDRQ